MYFSKVFQVQVLYSSTLLLILMILLHIKKLNSTHTYLRWDLEISNKFILLIIEKTRFPLSQFTKFICVDVNLCVLIQNHD